jgi:hypothetical protein
MRNADPSTRVVDDDDAGACSYDFSESVDGVDLDYGLSRKRIDS